MFLTKEKINLTKEKIKDVREGKVAHSHSPFKGDDIEEGVRWYSVEYDFFDGLENRTNNTPNRRHCVGCEDTPDNLFCYDQRNPHDCFDQLFCSRECWKPFDLDMLLDEQEKLLEEQEGNIDE